MIKNQILIAWRHLKRKRVFSLVNITGLAIGIAATLLILEYVVFELSYDRFHEKSHEIYRVINDRFQQGKLVQHGTITYPTIGPTLYEEYPEVVAYSRVTVPGKQPVKIGDRVFIETSTFVADENFFQMFSFPLLAGDRATCMDAYHAIALSRSYAEKYFGKKGESLDYSELIGQTILVDEDLEVYEITAIFEDIPANSHLQFDIAFSYESIITNWGAGADNSWTWSDFYHYVQLAPGTDYKTFEQKLDEFSERHFKGTEVSGSEEKFYLQPLADAHLYSDYEYEIGEVSNGKAVWALFFIAMFIIAIAWINYINLTTARAVERAKEVGIRKVLGAIKHQLIRQFITESAFLNILALVLALTIVQFSQPYFNVLSGSELSLIGLFSYGSGIILIGLGGAFIGGILLSSLYPAFILSAYRPSLVLKGAFKHTARGTMLRKGLVIFQFSCAALLIMATLTVFLQLRYMNGRSLGMNIERTLVIPGTEMTYWDSTYIDRANSFKHALTQYPDIESSCSSRHIPGDNLSRIFQVVGPKDAAGEGHTVRNTNIDYHFVETFGIPLAAGRNFRATDHNNDFGLIKTTLVNRTAARMMGFEDPREMVGEMIEFWDREWEVIGVLDDFHQVSPQYPIEPIVFIPSYSTNSFYSVKIATKDLQRTIGNIEKVYDEFFPGNAFEYFFMDTRYERQYQNDKRFGNIFSIFSVLAIIVACLGLFGLATYNVSQRGKEISIRKVLGAKSFHIWRLLSQEFFILIFVAHLIALPLAYFGMKNWLAEYTYRMDLAWWMFFIPLVVICSLAFFVIARHTIRASKQNPVDILRTE